jgi:acylphosphatase
VLNFLMSLFGLGSKGPQARAHLHAMGRIFEGNFPVYAEKKARQCNLRGWMALKNPFSTGAMLEFLVEGSDAAIKDFIIALRKPPIGCSVSKVVVEWQTFNHSQFHNFERRA